MASVTDIELKPAGNIQIKERARNFEQQEAELEMTGIVEYCRIRSKSKIRDIRMSRFDVLIHSQRALWGLLALWMAFTALGWFKMYQELRK